MDDLTSIVKGRKPPGILLVDAHCNLLCSNDEAIDILTAMDAEGEGGTPFTSMLREICGELKAAGEAPEVSVEERLIKSGDDYCALRGIRLDAEGGSSVMVVLMERGLPDMR